MKKTAILALAAVMTSALLSAQTDNKGYLTGSFESNSIGYVEDDKSFARVPAGNFGSNNYLKVDYYQGGLSAGLQMEAYQPALLGFPSNLQGTKLANYYINWSDKDFTLTAGTYYDQFGSGLLFRSYEDRTLGNNSALLGARLNWHYKDIFEAKLLWGVPRMPFTHKVQTDDEDNYRDGYPVQQEWADTNVRGVDVALSLANLLGMEGTTLSLEGSLLNRYQAVDFLAEEEGVDASTTGYSGRLNFERNGFVAKVELVDAGQKHYRYRSGENNYLIKNGNAQLVELGYSGGGLGVNLTARRLEWMNSHIDNRSMVLDESSITNNYLNYVPALCAQYSYLLTNLHPYTPMSYYINGNFVNSGEMGGQLDVYYNFRRGTLLGGKRGMKVNFNLSTYFNIAEEGGFAPGNMLWLNVNVGVEKQFNRKFKMQLLYAMQQRNTSYGMGTGTAVANVMVADLLYKYTPKFSTRLELQYLLSYEEVNGYDWMAALLEVNFAPRWSVYVSDMYNHGMEKVHYYNVGASYTVSRTRISLSYGRNREGMICSGGVCRMMPAYTGGNLTISTSF